ncbi:MAG: C40 family peptidase, partial [Chitinophagales bacterium]
MVFAKSLALKQLNPRKNSLHFDAVIKSTVLISSFILSVFCCSAQNIEPWWISNPPVDSASLKRTLIADSLLNYAHTFEGVPYVWGGNSPDSGFDCSGFVCYVYKKFDIQLPRTSGLQFNAGTPV